MKAKNYYYVLIFLLLACNRNKYPDGGYDYPKHIADKDTSFYYYPLKDVMPKKDSLLFTSTHLLLQQFNEYNLSLRSLSHDVFRLQYHAALGSFYIITLTENTIEVKKEKNHTELIFDENRLSQDEQKLYNTMVYYYPFDDISNFISKYVDSVNAINPKALTPAYFVSLAQKGFKPIDAKDLYTTTITKITNNDFKHLSETINNSGYWRMPYEFDCKDASMDGYTYLLEANTKRKYNFVSAISCNDSSAQRIQFAKACQEIIKYAHLEKEISIK